MFCPPHLISWRRHCLPESKQGQTSVLRTVPTDLTPNLATYTDTAGILSGSGDNQFCAPVGGGSRVCCEPTAEEIGLPGVEVLHRKTLRKAPDKNISFLASSLAASLFTVFTLYNAMK